MKDICPACGGQGFTVYPVCCGRRSGPDGECCGSPDPAQDPCAHCRTTGYIEIVELQAPQPPESLQRGDGPK